MSVMTTPVAVIWPWLLKARVYVSQSSGCKEVVGVTVLVMARSADHTVVATEPVVPLTPSLQMMSAVLVNTVLSGRGLSTVTVMTMA